MQVEDLIAVESQLGYRYELGDEDDHYQRYCPRCRRAMTALAQGRAFERSPSWGGGRPEVG
jgi:hypothetical protein